MAGMNAVAASAVPLIAIRRMFEGVIPAAMCTVGEEGMPHICFVSQVEYLDDQHVALSYQFLNRSRRNVLATRRAALSVCDPYTAASVTLQLEYLRTETSGSLFERMRAKLAGIASHSGMEKVFKLQGADVYRVVDIQRVPGRRELAAPAPRCDLAQALRAVCDDIAGCVEAGELLDRTLAGLQAHLRIEHAMVLMLDQRTQRLVTVASRGYATSGLGSEIPVGHGVAGIAAREGVPIRIGHLSMSQVYARAARQRTEELGLGDMAEVEIPLPGLADPRSQMAVPLRLFGRVQGVLLVESSLDQHFSYDDEDALTVLAGQLALALNLVQKQEADELPAPAAARKPSGPEVVVRHHAQQDAVFLDNDYLIKGVAGAIFRKLVADHLADGRTEFSNRELRLDASLKLPDIADNLEVRLLLLQRRLDERQAPVRIEKTGRGRFRLRLERPLRLALLRG
jgi:adenylate cyclase